MEIILPQRKIEPVVGLSDSGAYLWFGPPKHGKSTLMASLPDHQILSFDPGGYEYIAAHVTQVDPLTPAVNRLQLFVAFCQAIKTANTESPGSVKHAVIDTLNSLWLAIEELTCEKYEVKELGQIGNLPKQGNGWSIAYARFFGALKLIYTAPNVCWHLVTHTKRLYLDDKPAGRVPDLVGRLAREIPGFAKSVGFICSDQTDGQLIVSTDFKPTLQSEGMACRIPGWHNKRIILPKENGWDTLVKAAEGKEVPTLSYSSDITAIRTAVRVGKIEKKKGAAIEKQLKQHSELQLKENANAAT